MTTIRTGLVLAALLAVAACGGGGGSGSGSGTGVGDGGGSSGSAFPDTVRLETVRTLTGSDAPLETAADQAARAKGIVSHADSLIVSTVIAATNRPELEHLEFRTRCLGTRCLLQEPRTGVSGTIDLQDLEFSSGAVTEVLAKHGITMLEGMIDDIRSYGSWMHHAAFAVQTGRWVEDGIDIVGRYGFAGGDLTGDVPGTGISAEWDGVMVGTQRSGAFRGDVLQGDATLIYENSPRRGAGGSGTAGYIFASFANIVNIDRGAPYSVPWVYFRSIPVSADGTFSEDSRGDRIQGGFYGPDHAEAAGIFEKAGVVGAFGAKRR